MQAIKIESYLPKFYRQYAAELVAVRDIWIELGSSKKLLEYQFGTYSGYPPNFKPGHYLSLVFLGEDGIPFTHLHPYSAAAKALYNHQAGKSFRIEIEKKEACEVSKQVNLFDLDGLNQEKSEYENFKKWRESCKNEVV